ncbi:MAG: 2Fe-2S iron-sulfur cluster binding domain-containing protein [Spirochaetaceae bacterium]|nr:2Fe-2S iron-sulfur cluster binding domain-containing protein [Spirochaetaceae bacterium]
MNFLIAPTAIALIAATLAAAISIVDKIVNNYGEVDLSINDGKKVLKINGGDTILSSLASEGIFIPSACGGRGTCGACKCQVSSDVGPYLPTETPYMSKQELTDNIRLACQVKIKTDIGIEIPDELFNIRKYNTVITSIRDVTHDIKEINFDLQGEEINFKAGKYVQLVVPPHGKVKGTTQRAYSMSSKPGDKGKVELLVRLVPGGIATTWAHTLLEVGSKVELIGPFGDFYRSDTDATMICIAGGSGMAPFKSILYDMFDNGELDREVWYFFGARTSKDIFYVEEMMELDKKWDNFHFIAALSEPEEGSEWAGETGLITDVLDKYLKTKINPDKPKEGYLCGSPGMIDACNNVLTSNNMPLDKIYYDKF